MILRYPKLIEKQLVINLRGFAIPFEIGTPGEEIIPIFTAEAISITFNGKLRLFRQQQAPVIPIQFPPVAFFSKARLFTQ